MATFNGWTIVTLPTDPPAPSSIDFTLQDLVATVDNPFTGQQQFQDWQASFIEWSVSMPPLTRAQAPAWIAFLMSTRGSLNVFQMGDPLEGFGTGPAHNAVDLVAFVEQEFGQIRAVLARDAGDDRLPGHVCLRGLLGEPYCFS